MLRGTLQALFAAALFALPLAAAADHVIPEPASHYISASGSEALMRLARDRGDTIWYQYDRIPLPTVPDCTHVVITYYLLDPATGDRHVPLVAFGDGTVRFRMDGHTNAFLAFVNQDNAVSDVELRVDVTCVDPGNKATASALVQTIRVTF